jgi:chromosome segregation ATPase
MEPYPVPQLRGRVAIREAEIADLREKRQEDIEDLLRLEAEVERLQRSLNHAEAARIAAEDEIERLRDEARRAIETRENSNRVSIRVEGENRTFKAEGEKLREALRNLLKFGERLMASENEYERGIGCCICEGARLVSDEAER